MQVTDACSSGGVSEDIADGDNFDSELEAGDFGGQPELPGECDMIVKVQSSPLSATTRFKHRRYLRLQASAASAICQCPFRDTPHHS